MIQLIVTKNCPECGSDDIVRNGTDYKGDQKFHCHDCNAYRTLEPRGRYSEEIKNLLLRAYQERASMRGVERIFGVTRQTLARWMVEKAAALPDSVNTLAQARPEDRKSVV